MSPTSEELGVGVSSPPRYGVSVQTPAPRVAVATSGPAGPPGPPGPPGPEGGPEVYIQPAEPTTAVQGDFWVDTDDSASFNYVSVTEAPLGVGPPSGDTSGAADSAAIAAAIAKMPIGAGNIPGGLDTLLSAGTYYINAGIIATQLYNFRLRGMGRRATTIVPIGDLSGAPVVQLVDCRDAQLEDLWIQGLATGAAPAAIQSYRAGAAATVAGLNGHGLRVSRCLLGSDGGIVGIATGVQWKAAAGDATHDTNNDLSIMTDNEVINFAAAAYDIGHFNSLQHLIIGGSVMYGPTFVRCAGGSFTAIGTRLNALTGFAFDFLLPFGVHNYYTHRCAAIGLMAESPSQVARSASTIAGTVPVRLAIIGAGWLSAPVGGATMVDWQAPGGMFNVTDSVFDFGQANCVASFADAASTARFTNSALAFTTISYKGRLVLHGNKHIPGAVTLTNLGGGTLDQFGDSGGGFTTDTTARPLTVGGAISQVTGTPNLAAVSGNFGAGATNSLTAGSNDLAMEVTINSGTSGFVAQAGQQVNFGASHGAAPKAINVTPMNIDTSSLGVPYVSSKGTANFVFRAPNVPVASKTYVWDITCVF